MKIMRLSQVKKQNDTYYYVLDSYRDKKDKSKVITKKILTIGSHSSLLKTHEDPLAYAKEVVRKLNEEKKQNKATYEDNVDYSEKIEANSNLTTSLSTLKNVGWQYLKSIYDKFELDDFFDKRKGRQEYNPNEINMMYSVLRVLEPQSKSATLKSLYKYYEAPSISKNSGFDFLKFFAPYKDEYQEYLYNKTKNIVDLDESILYYDCTNYYFEGSDDEDEIGDDGEILQYGFRKYGYSKEHRPNPIVSMGLFADAKGIPLAFDIFHGKTSDQETAIPLELKMTKYLDKKDFIYCADSGINSAKIRFFNSLNGRKYVVSQSLRKVKDSDVPFVFSDENWKFVHDNSPISFVKFKNIVIKYANGEELTEEECRLIEKDLIYKVVPTKRVVSKGEFANVNLQKDIEFEDDLWITFSAKYYLYEKNILNKQVIRAQKFIEKSGKKDIYSNPNSPKRLIKSVCVNKDGVVVNVDEVSVLDESKIDSEEQVLGLFGTCTNIKDTNIHQILNINKRRWQIELNFRLLKSELQTRPAFVWTRESIITHFSVCYTGLLLLKILERKLETSVKNLDNPENLFTTNSLIQMLKDMNYSNHNNTYYEAQYTGSKMLNLLEETFNLGFNKRKIKINSLH